MTAQQQQQQQQHNSAYHHAYDDEEMYETQFHHHVGQEDSVLLTHVRGNDWAGALARLASHPSEAATIGMQGRTALHVACDQDAPAVVVQALLKAYPEASVMVGTSKMNPLHITCSSQHASAHVVRVLLECGLGVEAKMCDVDGDTPLHAACRCGAPIDVLEALMRANPDAVRRRDYEGLTPLLRLWVRYFVILGDDVIDAVRGQTDLTGELGEAWKKTELLLRCAHYGSLQLADQHPWAARIVHAASGVDCPRAVVKIATILYPRHLEDIDEQLRTPLIIAAKAPIFKVRDLSDEGYLLEDHVLAGDNNNGSGNETEGPDESSSPAEPSVIQILIDASSANAACSTTNKEGRLPLHVAIRSGKQWKHGIKSILAAYPEALLQQDPSTRLYPFLLAAIDQKCHGQVYKPDLGTLYELLRANPAVSNRALQRGDDSDNSRNNHEYHHCQSVDSNNNKEQPTTTPATSTKNGRYHSLNGIRQQQQTNGQATK